MREMETLPTDIYPVSAVRDVDHCAIEEHGIPGYTLMTRAAAAALAITRAAYPGARRWLVLAGPGNNAGDAYAMARLARSEGLEVELIALTDTARLNGDAATAAADFQAAGGVVEPYADSLPPGADLVVDGLFGSGLQRNVGGNFAKAVEQINAYPAPVIALDIPSGIDGDTGNALGIAVRAELTVAFVGLKSGYFLGDGIDSTGRLEFAGLDVPETCYEPERAILQRISAGFVRTRLPGRRRNAHKGHFGHVLVIGGSPGMPGAAIMTGLAALRSGAGRVTLATHPEHAPQIVARCPELMVRAIADAAELESIAERADVIALGPGLGDDAWSKAVFDVAARIEVAAVWDAGALGLLAAARPSPHPDRIITPHPGEAGKLLGLPPGRVQSERLQVLDLLIARYGGVVVLKGACSLVGSEGERRRVATCGNPGMATAGAGDILTGVIAGLRGQGMPALDAATVGVYVHGRAGDLAAGDGERGMLATDLLPGIRRLVNP